jgi:hypothetical protein
VSQGRVRRWCGKSGFVNNGDSGSSLAHGVAGISNDNKVMKMRRAIATMTTAAVMAVAMAVGVAAQAAKAVPVFVASEATGQGFTDPSKDRRDSIKDVEKKVKDSNALMLVDKAEDAVIVIEVLGRETKREVNGWTAFSGYAQNKSSLTVRMKVGDYTTEFSGESGSKGMLKGYGDAANKVVKQVEEWVKVNRGKLPVNGGH